MIDMTRLDPLSRKYRRPSDALRAVCSELGFYETYELDGNGVTCSVSFHTIGRPDLFVVFCRQGLELDGGQTHFCGFDMEEASAEALSEMTAGFRGVCPQTGLDIEVPPFGTVEELRMKLGVAGRMNGLVTCGIWTQSNAVLNKEDGLPLPFAKRRRRP